MSRGERWHSHSMHSVISHTAHTHRRENIVLHSVQSRAVDFEVAATGLGMVPISYSRTRITATRSNDIASHAPCQLKRKVRSFDHTSRIHQPAEAGNDELVLALINTPGGLVQTPSTS